MKKGGRGLSIPAPRHCTKPFSGAVPGDFRVQMKWMGLWARFAARNDSNDSQDQVRILKDGIMDSQDLLHVIARRSNA